MKKGFFVQTKRNLQFMIAVSFTLISVIGMLALGLMLYATYTRTAEELTIEDKGLLLEIEEKNGRFLKYTIVHLERGVLLSQGVRCWSASCSICY